MYVPVGAIAAALPRLHTLHASNDRTGHNFGVAEFYGELLPRLQSFHFEGWWPGGERNATPPSSLLPLPRLHDLKWMTHDRQQRAAMQLPREFMGAHPVSLQGYLPAVAEWLTTVEVVHRESTASGPLVRARDLWLEVASLRAHYSDIARLLFAAPLLRRLTVQVADWGEEIPRLLVVELITDPAFAGLVHPRLRHLIVECGSDAQPDSAAAADCAFVLQQRRFPRLRRLTLDDQDYPVSPAE
jgi:hypothetical protein